MMLYQWGKETPPTRVGQRQHVGGSGEGTSNSDIHILRPSVPERQRLAQVGSEAAL